MTSFIEPDRLDVMGMIHKLKTTPVSSRLDWAHPRSTDVNKLSWKQGQATLPISDRTEVTRFRH